jgi:hypothetical protein
LATSCRTMDYQSNRDSIMLRDIILIILGASISSAFYFIRELKHKKEIKKQERFNKIK